MEVLPYMPIIVEATRFVFNEVGKWIDRVRQRSDRVTPQHYESALGEEVPRLTPQSFAALEADPTAMVTTIDAQLAETNAYVIRGLMEQIQVHRRNLIDHEKTEAEYGALTPQYVRRAIEHEATAIIQKYERLKSLLEQLYGRRIENA